MRDVRVLRGLKSRRRQRGASRTKTPIALTREGQRQELELALGQAPVLLRFPIFSPPALHDPAGYTSVIRLIGIHSVLFGPRPEHVSGDFHKIVMREPGYMPVAFAKLLAKIAYGITAAQGHLHRIDSQAGVLPAILGQREDIGVWVGTLDQPVGRHEGLLHRTLIHEDSGKGLLIGEVQLFADSEAPSYGVILGRLASSGPSDGSRNNPQALRCSFQFSGLFPSISASLSPFGCRPSRIASTMSDAKQVSGSSWQTYMRHRWPRSCANIIVAGIASEQIWIIDDALGANAVT